MGADPRTAQACSPVDEGTAVRETCRNGLAADGAVKAATFLARSIAFTLMALLAAGCSRDADESLPAHAAPTGQQLSLSSDPVAIIGGADYRDGYAIGRLADAALVGDRIVVADRMAGEVRYFDGNGTLTSRSGRLGGGPGEYRAIRMIRPRIRSRPRAVVGQR